MKPISIPLSGQVPDVKTSKLLNAALDKAGVEVEVTPNYCYSRTREMSRGGKIFIGEWKEWGFGSYSKERGSWWNRKDIREYIPAYTLPELLAVLPKEIKLKKHIYPHWLIMTFDIHKAYIRYNGHQDDGFPTLKGFTAYYGDINLPTATAKLIIWCVKNGYIGGVNV